MGIMKNHKLGMDVRMIRHSGIGVRIQNILKFWKPIDNWDLYLFGDPDVLGKFNLPEHKEIIPYKKPIYSIAELNGHPRMKEMDVLDIPHFNVPIPYLKKSIVTIHDLIPWVLRDLHSSFIKRMYLQFVLSRIFKRAKKIVTVSEFTKQDIIREFGKFKPNPEVVYNGINHDLYKEHPKKEVLEFRKKYKLPEKFLLTVGIGKGHKNQEFLIKTLATDWEIFRVPQDRFRNGKAVNQGLPPLVIAGTGGKAPDYLKDLIAKWKNHIILLPRIPDEEMPLMYQSAELLVYPSLYEGFGFPVLEAGAVGCPVLSSHASVLPEILGDSGIFFDPSSQDDLLNQLESTLSMDSSSLDKYKGYLKKQSQQFQWRDSVERMREILTEK